MHIIETDILKINELDIVGRLEHNSGFNKNVLKNKRSGLKKLIKIDVLTHIKKVTSETMLWQKKKNRFCQILVAHL